MKFSRHWAMPSPDTFEIEPIGQFVQRYVDKSRESVDPFARNNQVATHRNDINPNTTATDHMDAVDYLNSLGTTGVRCDLAILDPPYSPRQISECYKESGIECGMAETQNASLYRRVKNSLLPIMENDSVVLSFGWNTSGMGRKRGFQIIEIMLVAHGGAHNDTICTAERLMQRKLF